MPWYEGATLLSHLERLHVASDRNFVDVRFPVQYVVRPQSKEVLDYRGYAGTVASGVLKPGDLVVALPSGLESTIASIETADGPVDEAYPPMSVTIRLTDDIDLRRGDMLCRPHNVPTVAQDIDAQVCWMDESAPLAVGRKYAHQAHDALGAGRWSRRSTTGSTSTRSTATRTPTELSLNEIGRIQLRATQPLFVDPYLAEPRDGRVHPGRRGQQQDGRRRDDRADQHGGG